MALRSFFPLRVVAQCALFAGVVLLLAPAAARADSCQSNSLETCVANTDGMPGASGSGTNTTFSLTNSEVTGIGWKSGGVLGHLNFKTGDLEAGGSLMTGGTFSATNSSFSIKGTYNNISNGTIFTGSFTGPVQWQLINPSTCSASTACEYDLTGNLIGTWNPNGPNAGVTGVTIQLYFKTTSGYYTGAAGSLTDIGGYSNFDTPLVTPEPSTLALMGTGLVGIGMMAKRKLSFRMRKSQAPEGDRS
jgi:hypothetical protein